MPQIKHSLFYLFTNLCYHKILQFWYYIQIASILGWKPVHTFLRVSPIELNRTYYPLDIRRIVVLDSWPIVLNGEREIL